MVDPYREPGEQRSIELREAVCPWCHHTASFPSDELAVCPGCGARFATNLPAVVEPAPLARQRPIRWGRWLVIAGAAPVIALVAISGALMVVGAAVGVVAAWLLVRYVEREVRRK